MEEIVKKVLALPEPDEVKVKFLQALQSHNQDEIYNFCMRLIEIGEGSIANEICNFCVNNFKFHPGIANILAYLSYSSGMLDDAVFYFFSSYVFDSNKEAGLNLSRIFIEIGKLEEAREILVDLKKMYGDDSEIDSELLSLGKDNKESDLPVFVVSTERRVWPAVTKSVYIADPFIKHMLERDGGLDPLVSVQNADFPRSDADDLVEWMNFVGLKYDQYLEILYVRLNTVHGTSFTKEFWQRSMSVCFERMIFMIYDMYKVCEKFFIPKKFSCRVLSKDSYYIPFDFDEQRAFLEHWQYGREQLFACYINTFFKGEFDQVHLSFDSPYSVRELSHVSGNNPVVGIMGAYFAAVFNDHLINGTQGNINFIGFKRDLEVDKGFTDMVKRNDLFRQPEGADRFDEYFFNCLPYLMPKVFVEFFHDMIGSYRAQLSCYSNLKYVVSEIWLGECYEPVALALLKEDRGIKTILNEHNYSEHPYKASMFPRWAKLCDIVAAHGTYGQNIDNVLQMGSLYDYGYSVSNVSKERNITYVSGLSLARDVDGSCSGANSGYNHHSVNYYNFKQTFFKNLNEDIKGQLWYRGYPFDDYARHWCAYYDDRYLMKDFLHGVKFDDLSKSGKVAMASSNLVVVDYMMTAHLESMSLNLPTIILFSADRTVFSKEYENYLDELIEAGICQLDPLAAARFIERVIVDPEAWWQSSVVQSAKNNFLAKNLGEPLVFYNYLMGLAGVPV